MMNNKQLRELRRPLCEWFAANQRDLPWRRTRDPYHIWVSEVMLQQTQVGTVAPFFEKFVDRYPDILTLAAAPLQDVLKAWERMGYYARARNLHAAARRLADETGGRVPHEPKVFRSLPGVGDYIAAAVMSIAFDRPMAVVDGNVKRVLSRLLLIDEPVNKPASTRRFTDEAQRLLDVTSPGAFNQAMMELGATVCRPANPACDVCPVSAFCQAFFTGKQKDYPKREKKRPTPHYHIAIGVVQKDDRILITQRKESGLLGGLWEFPGGKVRQGEPSEEACKREIAEETNLDIEVGDYLTHVDHAYSHFKIGVDVYSCKYQAGDVKLNGPVDHRWILIDDIDRYPFPVANHKFIPLLKKKLKG